MTTSNNENVTWQVTTSEDPDTGDLILPIPEELLQRLGWKEGDTLTWNTSADGHWILAKK